MAPGYPAAIIPNAGKPFPACEVSNVTIALVASTGSRRAYNRSSYWD